VKLWPVCEPSLPALGFGVVFSVLGAPRRTVASVSVVLSCGVLCWWGTIHQGEQRGELELSPPTPALPLLLFREHSLVIIPISPLPSPLASLELSLSSITLARTTFLHPIPILHANLQVSRSPKICNANIC
jgi:hypothetical protein